MEQRLREILGIVNGHQQFAEAKNAALLALDGALIFALLQVLTGTVPLGRWTELYLLEFLVCASISGLVSLLSFIPQTRVPGVRVLDDVGPRDALIFFGDIQKYSAEAYLNALREAAGESALTHGPPLENVRRTDHCEFADRFEKIPILQICSLDDAFWNCDFPCRFVIVPSDSVASH